MQVDYTNQTQIIKAGAQHRLQIVSLLNEEKLPVDDLPLHLDHFFVALRNEEVTGVIGLEQYGNYGLLRSMVVDKRHRKQNIATFLVAELEAYARSIGIDSLFLLTETAPQYFESKWYKRITRDEVPKELRSSSEFSHVCPASAIVMKKRLRLV